MHSWNMGYDTDTNYEYLYFGQLNPFVLRFNFLSQGLAFPELNENTCACELGFGNGISVIMHAAGSPVQWHANDFNPSQVEYAQLLAKHSSVKVNLTDDAFDQFLAREDLPMFDYICLHGIWSWISPENQDVIVNFIKSKLKVGGVVYISYNVKPGFCSIAPLRILMNSYLENVADPSNNHVQNMPQALEFIDKLMKLNPAYTRKAQWVEEFYHIRITDQERNYVSHEFCNNYWDLSNFNIIADKLEQAKLTYVCAAHMIDNAYEYDLTPNENKALLPWVGTPLQQQVHDFVTACPFRSDVYVKGMVKLSPNMQQKALDESYFICTNYDNTSKLTFKTRPGQVDIDTERLAPLMSIMDDNEVHCYKDLRLQLCEDPAEGNNKKPAKGYKAASTFAKLSPEQLFDDVVYAVTTGMIKVALPPDLMTDEVVERCQKLNKFIITGNVTESITALCSPVLGGGIFVDELDRVLLAVTTSLDDVDENTILAALMNASEKSRSITFKDKVITDSQEILATLKDYAHNFIHSKLKIYRKLKII